MEGWHTWMGSGDRDGQMERDMDGQREVRDDMMGGSGDDQSEGQHG